MKTYKAYRQLCTEFYNISKAWASAQELEWYCAALEGLNGPILEAMCGSGRLLIPLIKNGFIVEGVDNSQDMLESCAQRMVKQGITAPLYFQDVAYLSLPKQYEAIIVAVGSFQLITDQDKALKIVQNFYNYLKPGGMLLLDTFVPELDTPQQELITRIVDCPDGSIIKLTCNLEKNDNEQIYTSDSLYERIKDSRIVENEHELLSVTWYTQSQMEELLTKAGFSCIEEYRVIWEEFPITMYKAIKS